MPTWLSTCATPWSGCAWGFYGPAGYGPLTMLLMTCSTALEAFRLGQRVP